jgi:hypothetical protein
MVVEEAATRAVAGVAVVDMAVEIAVDRHPTAAEITTVSPDDPDG